METSIQIVMVPVPVDRLTEVYALLGNRPTQVELPTAVEEPFSVPYTASEMALLKENLRKDGAAYTLLDLCAKNPDRLIGFDEVVEKSGLEEKVARGQFGALTKVINRLFSGKKPWPVHNHWAAGDKVQYYYQMPQSNAELWLAIGGPN